jgi:hypothetical protein
MCQIKLNCFATSYTVLNHETIILVTKFFCMLASNALVG